MASISDQISLRTISRSNTGSSHGQNIPFQDDSPVESPIPSPVRSPVQSLLQPQRERPVQEQDITANVEHMEDENETQAVLSSLRAPSNPGSIQGGKDTPLVFLRRATHWKTVGIIIGFLFAALLSALGHYLLFRNLDGELTDTSYLTQPQTSAISFLLTTMFKAALTASVGTCFAQHLWLVLRGNAMPLNTIEKLFTLRTSVFAMFDMRSIWRAPLLFLMALFVWCLGIATIYPPGALVVTSESYISTERSNMSVMNPPIPSDLDFTQHDFPKLSFGGINFQAGVNLNVNGETSYEGPSAASFAYYGPTPALTSVARSIIIDNHVFNLPNHPGENSTYKLEFRGPQLRCDVSTYNSSIPLEYDEEYHTLSGAVFVSAWNKDSLTLSIKHHNISSFSTVLSDHNTKSYQADVETTELVCGPKSVLYNVHVSFPRGVQKIEYGISDENALLKKWKEAADVNLWSNSSWATMSLTLPAQQQAARDFNQKMIDALPAFNQWALLDALGSLLDGEYHEVSANHGSCIRRTNPENGIVTEDCADWGLTRSCPTNLPPNSPEAPLRGTVFEPARFTPDSPQVCYDPRKELNLTEAILNDVLTNITLSAISLGTWWDEIEVNYTRYQSTYSFANPINLILPYSVCLAVATAFAATAIWSLSRNGIPAADGGFLQIMTATRGNTEMERLVLRENLTTVENMSEELKALRVRYGELVGEDVVGANGRTVGFGTIEETISLRKRK